eukprot:Nk52_evm39s1444 gene=Nk52_evmTU39s1444
MVYCGKKVKSVKSPSCGSKRTRLFRQAYFVPVQKKLHLKGVPSSKGVAPLKIHEGSIHSLTSSQNISEKNDSQASTPASTPTTPNSFFLDPKKLFSTSEEDQDIKTDSAEEFDVNALVKKLLECSKNGTVCQLVGKNKVQETNSKIQSYFKALAEIPKKKEQVYSHRQSLVISKIWPETVQLARVVQELIQEFLVKYNLPQSSFKHWCNVSQTQVSNLLNHGRNGRSQMSQNTLVKTLLELGRGVQKQRESGTPLHAHKYQRNISKTNDLFEIQKAIFFCFLISSCGSKITLANEQEHDDPVPLCSFACQGNNERKIKRRRNKFKVGPKEGTSEKTKVESEEDHISSILTADLEEQDIDWGIAKGIGSLAAGSGVFADMKETLLIPDEDEEHSFSIDPSILYELTPVEGEVPSLTTTPETNCNTTSFATAVPTCCKYNIMYRSGNSNCNVPLITPTVSNSNIPKSPVEPVFRPFERGNNFGVYRPSPQYKSLNCPNIIGRKSPKTPHFVPSNVLLKDSLEQTFLCDKDISTPERNCFTPGPAHSVPNPPSCGVKRRRHNLKFYDRFNPEPPFADALSSAPTAGFGNIEDLLGPQVELVENIYFSPARDKFPYPPVLGDTKNSPVTRFDGFANSQQEEWEILDCSEMYEQLQDYKACFKGQSFVK